MRVAVLGAGAWGTAMAVALAARHDTLLWARDAAQAAAMTQVRCNARYLPEVMLPPALRIDADLAAACTHAAGGMLLLATPMSGLRGLLQALPGRQPALWLCKGFEAGSGLLGHEIARELRPEVPCGVLSGPSFALEVARGLPTAVTLAAADADLARRLARALHQPRLRTYFTDDLVGVEVGGAVKNVMAIATGISDGLGLGLNARAALVTRGLAEVARLGVALGGRAETFMGLAGAGDLILTCTGDLSRNRRVGLALGRGERLDAILAGLGHVAEGVHSAREVDAIARARAIDMPITREVCAVLFARRLPADAVAHLLARDPRGE